MHFMPDILRHEDHQPCRRLLQGSLQARPAPGDPQGPAPHLCPRGPGGLFLPVRKTQQTVTLLEDTSPLAARHHLKVQI